jgi:hypothetical protein
MARSRNPHRENYWRQHHQRQHASGLTIGGYCARECISAAAFYAWKKRLATSLPALATPLRFIPVNLASTPAGTAACQGIEIELSRHVRLRLDSLPEPEWLCRVAAELAGLLGKEVIS